MKKSLRESLDRSANMLTGKKRQPLKKKKLIGMLTPTGLIPASHGVVRKFMRMTLAERTKFVELFAGFSDADWRRFKRWIKKLKEK